MAKSQVSVTKSRTTKIQTTRPKGQSTPLATRGRRSKKTIPIEVESISDINSLEAQDRELAQVDKIDKHQGNEEMTEMKKKLLEMQSMFSTPMEKYKLTTVEDTLDKVQAENANMQEQLSNRTNMGSSNEAEWMIPRPKGTAGTDFGIQDAMGLSENKKGYEIYKGIQVRQA